MSHEKPGVYSAPLEKPLDRLLTPFEEFIHRQTSSGLLLLLTATLAVIVGNSALAGSYQHFLHLPVALSFGAWSISLSLHHWINDGLMAFFFFVVGLELKRELLVGELASLRKAALPAIAALGGMIVPAFIYYLISPPGDMLRGWGVPMATDIAFAVGALALLASRVPRALITFLVALAIVDDLGAVLVIAVFYTSDINASALGAGATIVGLLLLLNLAGVRKTLPYFLLAMGLWYALLLSGLHPTLAGVLGAFTVPARPKYDPGYFSNKLRRLTERFDHSRATNPHITANDDLRSVVSSIESSAQKVMAPLQRLESLWHLPVAYLIIPVFAFANAGIPVTLSELPGKLAHPVFLGVFFGLFLGKFIGISLATFLALKLRIAELPAGTSFNQIMGVSLLGGIGFTMSIFISRLAFQGQDELITIAMTGIFAASIVSGLCGFIWLWLAGRRA